MSLIASIKNKTSILAELTNMIDAHLGQVERGEATHEQTVRLLETIRLTLAGPIPPTTITPSAAIKLRAVA